MRKSVLVYLVLIISIFCYANICFAATKGDINGDGRINESDRQILSDYLQGRKNLTDYEKSLADINGDSIVDNRDLDILTQIAKGTYSSYGDILGDVNSDGRLDSQDYDLLLAYVQGKATLTNRAMAVADANRDGAINILDCVWVLNIVKGKTYYPVEMADVPDGWYKISPIRAQDMSLTIKGGVIDKSQAHWSIDVLGQTPYIEKYTNDDYHKFYIQRNGDSYAIRSKVDNMYMRTIENGRVNFGLEGDSIWKFIKSNGAYYLVSIMGEAGKVLDNKGSSYVEMSTIDNLDSQRWVLKEVDAPSSNSKPSTPDNKQETDKNKDNNNNNNNSADDNKKDENSNVNGKYYTVSTPCQNLLLRKAANNKSEVIAKMPKGSKVIVTSIDNNGWASVEFQGQKGYAFAKFLTKGE